MNREVKLNDWAIVMGTSDPYKAPEQATMRLAGNVVGHPGGPDGPVTTSTVKVLDTTKKIATTRNTTYRLGEIKADFKDYLKDNNYKLSDYDYDEGKK